MAPSCAYDLALCNQAPSASQLSKEWLELTGDSYIVDVREFYGESVVDGFWKFSSTR